MKEVDALWSPSSLPGVPIQDALGPKRTHLGLLTRYKGSPQLLTELKVRLQAIALGGETGEALAEVDAALNCRLGGTGRTAIKVLACWAGPISKERLLRFDPVIWRSCRNTRDQFERWINLFGVNLYAPLFQSLPQAEAQELLARVLQTKHGPARIMLTFTTIDRRRWKQRDEVLKLLAAGDDAAAHLAQTALIEERISEPSTMSADQFSAAFAAFKTRNFGSAMQYALSVSGRTIQLWASGELRVPERVAMWLRTQIEARQQP